VIKQLCLETCVRKVVALVSGPGTCSTEPVTITGTHSCCKAKAGCNFCGMSSADSISSELPKSTLKLIGILNNHDFNTLKIKIRVEQVSSIRWKEHEADAQLNDREKLSVTNALHSKRQNIRLAKKLFVITIYCFLFRYLQSN
jgi:hypothetical protein